MKVYIQVIDTITGVYQTGMIDEPVQKGYEIKNAIEHFTSSNINWISETEYNKIISKTGKVEGTTKVISIIAI